jgi:hypothetical protein
MKLPLLLSLFLLPFDLPVQAQTVTVPDTNKSGFEHQEEGPKIIQRAELFLNACIQRNWKKAETFVSTDSPLIPLNKDTADEQLVGRVEKFEIWDVDGADYPTAVVFGCAKLSGRGRGTFRFLMDLETEKQERKIYHFEVLRESMDRPPIKCSFRN